MSTRKHTLEFKNLYVSAENKEVVRGVSFSVKSGELHVLMGPNGSGKSSLCHVLMGHPNYQITKGDILFDGKSIQKLTPDKRAQLGLFLGFQYPREIPGVTYGNFLRLTKNSLIKHRDPKAAPLSPGQFLNVLKPHLKLLSIPSQWISRPVNEGFSGGEKKRAELLQLAVFEPSIAVLDEIDSGLDIDSMKLVAKAIPALMKQTGMGALLITHYQRLVEQMDPTRVYVMMDGKIVRTGGKELIGEVEKVGYETMQK